MKFASLINPKTILGAAAAFALAQLPSQAAFLIIDDSDPDNITISAGDFEDGFFLDNVLFTTGLGNSNTATFLDRGFSVAGNWTDLGDTQLGARVGLLFAHVGDPTAVTSGIELAGSSDGITGTITGSTGGYTGVPYFFTLLPTFDQNGPAQSANFPFLEISFTPEHTGVPDAGSTALLLSFALSGFVVARRRAQS